MACGLNTCLELSSNVKGTHVYRRNPLKVQITYTLLYVNTQYMFVTPTQSPKYNSLNTTAVSII